MLNKLKELGLVRKSINNNNSRELVTIELVGDCNDADYNTRKTIFYLDKEYNIDKLKRVAELLKDKNNLDIIHSTGFFRGEYELEKFNISKEKLEELEEEVTNLLDIPFGDDRYCHTLESITIYYTDKTGNTIELEIMQDK